MSDNRTWVAWITIACFAFLFMKVNITGTGLGTQPTPVAWEQLATPKPNTNHQPVKNIFDSSHSLTQTLINAGVLTVEEYLFSDPLVGEGACKWLILSLDNRFQGRLCLADADVYRLSPHGFEDGPRWQQNTQGAWVVDSTNA